MKIQVRRLAVALVVAGPLVMAGAAKSSAAPMNGTSIKAAAPAVTIDVRYRGYSDYPYASYWGSPTYYYYEDPVITHAAWAGRAPAAWAAGSARASRIAVRALRPL